MHEKEKVYAVAKHNGWEGITFVVRNIPDLKAAPIIAGADVQKVLDGRELMLDPKFFNLRQYIDYCWGGSDENHNKDSCLMRLSQPKDAPEDLTFKCVGKAVANENKTS